MKLYKKFKNLLIAGLTATVYANCIVPGISFTSKFVAIAALFGFMYVVMNELDRCFSPNYTIRKRVKGDV